MVNIRNPFYVFSNLSQESKDLAYKECEDKFGANFTRDNLYNYKNSMATIITHSNPVTNYYLQLIMKY